MGSKQELALGLSAVIALPGVGAGLGLFLSLLRLPTGWILAAVIGFGALVGLSFCKQRTLIAIVGAGLVQQGLMLFLLFEGLWAPSIEVDPVAYARLPWILLLEATYVVVFVGPGLVAREAVIRFSRRRAGGGLVSGD